MSAITSLDLDFIRQQFPNQHWQWSFFENAGGAFVPNSVINRMSSYMSETQVQPGYPNSVSMDAAKRMNHGHQLMAEFIGADRNEVTISASTSINIYVLAQALRGLWQAGDEIIVSTLNHEANSGPWRRLEEFGIKIVEWPCSLDSPSLDVNELDQLLSDKTRLVAFPHVSNITGDINDVKAITARVHEAEALVCVDGVAYAPHRTVDVKDWNVDFYVFSFYKVFGPHLGCIYGKKEILLDAKGQGHYFFPEDDLAHKLNPAGPNHESIAALVGIADYFDCLYEHHFEEENANFFQRARKVYALISEHEQSLAQYFLDFIKDKKQIRLIGRMEAGRDARVPTFSMQFEDVSSLSVPSLMAKDKVAIAAGHFYAKRFLDSVNLEEKDVVRCSMAHYNTHEDVERLIRSLDSLLS
jgi:cysteine desulfurase family protein (TIGR01976 family)